MNEHPKYNWSYAVAFFLFDYPMLIVADWITDGWHNIHWGRHRHRGSHRFSGADTRSASDTKTQMERQKLQLMHIAVFCGSSMPKKQKQ